LTALGKRRLGSVVHAGDASFADTIKASLNANERAVLLEACALLERLSEALGTAPEAGPPAVSIPATPRRRKS
jgi:hypothetical protein